MSTENDNPMFDDAVSLISQAAELLHMAHSLAPELGRHYVIEPEQLAALRQVERRLNAGSDLMRDQGYIVWRTLNGITQEY